MENQRFFTASESDDRHKNKKYVALKLNIVVKTILPGKLINCL